MLRCACRCSPFGDNIALMPYFVLILLLFAAPVRAVKRKRDGVQFCNFHGKRHSSAQWHYGSGTDPFIWCQQCYKSSRRADTDNIGLWHPTRDAWKHLADVGVTGFQIVLLRNRPDIQALCSVSALCRARGSWNKLAHIIFILVFMLQLYWQWPMITLWTLLSATRPTDLTHEMLQEKLKIVRAMYKHVKVRKGVLHAGNIGLSVLKNPSEGRSGVSRFIRLSKEIDVWRNCAEHLAAHFETTFKLVLRPVLEILNDAKLRTYDHKPIYKNIRVIRALVTSTGNTCTDTPDCWSRWRQMSKKIRAAVLASGLWDFKDAVRFRDAMAKTLNEAYTFADLLCFMCLQNSECFDHNSQN